MRAVVGAGLMKRLRGLDRATTPGRDRRLNSDWQALDNPIGPSLATRHAALARGGALARRYPRDTSPLGGFAGACLANVEALSAVVDVGDDIALVGPYAPELPPNWETLYTSQITQMLRMDRTLQRDPRAGRGSPIALTDRLCPARRRSDG